MDPGFRRDDALGLAAHPHSIELTIPPQRRHAKLSAQRPDLRVDRQLNSLEKWGQYIFSARQVP
jgi:hypothetical protein